MTGRSARRGAPVVKAEVAAADDSCESVGTAPAAAEEEEAAAGASSSAELDYEARRQQQIQRNQQLLTQLTGVAASTSLSREQAAAMAEARAQAAQHSKEARARARAERTQRLALMPRRDMPSRRARGDVNYSEDAIAVRAASGNAAAAGAQRADAEESADATPRVNASLSDFVVPDNYPIGLVSTGTSSKLVPTQPLSVLAAYLGRTIPLLYHTPKSSAMSFLVAGWPSEDNPASKRAPPTFNKMSGIQKLASHVAIFINVDESAPVATMSMKGSSSVATSYGNQWRDSGRRLTWYAQPTQRVDTPVIGQIIAAARAQQARMDGSAAREGDEYARAVLGDGAGSASAPAAAAADTTAAAPSKRAGSKRKASPEPVVKLEPVDGSSASAAAAAASSVSSSAGASSSSASSSSSSFDPFSLLLFLRHVGGPYVYAGRLAYSAHDTTRIPMQFVFTLADFDTLIQQEDFRSLLPDEGKAALAEIEAQGAAAAGAPGKLSKT